MSFCFCTDQKDVVKNVYEVHQELGVGELSLSGCPGVGNKPPRKKKNCKSPGVCLGGGKVTSKIEPCISDQLMYGVVSIIYCMYCAEYTMHVLYRVYEEL